MKLCKLLFMFLLVFTIGGQFSVTYGQKKSGKRRVKVTRPETAKATIPVKTAETDDISPDIQLDTVVPAPVSNTDDSLVIEDSRRSALSNEKIADETNVSTDTSITANSNTIIKVFLAERGVSLIEFPAGDPVYAIYPGDENFVTIDCQRDESVSDGGCANSADDAIILRPGKLFTKWQSDPNSTATVITVQRVSGKVISFIVMPARTIAENTFHIIVRYDLNKVVDARMRAGLTVNLNKNSRPASGVPDVPAVKNSSGEFSQANYVEETSVSPPTEVNAEIPVETFELRALTRLKTVAESKEKLYFSKPKYGISLAVTKSDRTKDYTVDVVAVRNTADQPLRLVPDQPELFIVNTDNKEKTNVIRESVPIIYVATTADDDYILIPGKVYYFVIVYRQPIMGAKQNLEIAFASRLAADAPAVASLSKINDK